MDEICTEGAKTFGICSLNVREHQLHGVLLALNGMIEHAKNVDGSR